MSRGFAAGVGALDELNQQLRRMRVSDAMRANILALQARALGDCDASGFTDDRFQEQFRAVQGISATEAQAQLTRALLGLASTSASAGSEGKSFAARPDTSFQPRKDRMLPAGTFRGRVALVTGGGTGLGLSMAHALGDLGATVCISGRKRHVLEETTAALREATGATIHALPMDVRDEASVKDALDALETEFGLPDVIVNNACVTTAAHNMDPESRGASAGNFIAPTERLSLNAFRTIVDVVLNGSANVTLQAGKRLIQAKKPGSFLSISTTYADAGSGFVVPSACAKAGVNTMVRSLAAEWGRYGLRFVGIAPGPIETKGAFERLDPSGQFKPMMIERNPSGRLGEQAELANLATYLLSDYASWINGEVVALDGGELPSMSGEFNALRALSPEQWDMMEAAIRGQNKRGS